MELSKIFNYSGNEVTFKTSDGVTYINATEMGKSFGKQPVHWLNQSGTNEFISELSKLRNRSLADLVVVIKGGVNPGTWMHEDVALEFSRWLSPAFSIWCNDKIKELINTGSTSLEQFNIPKTYAEALRLAADLNDKVEEQEKQLKIQEPKVEYVDKLLKSETSFSTTELAADFGMSAIKFNKLLIEKGVIRKMRTGYVLCSAYLNRGYEYMLPIEKEGQSKRQLRWTERGRAFIHYLLDKPMQTKITLIS